MKTRSIIIRFVSKMLAPSKEIPKYQTEKGIKKENRETQRGSPILIILNDALTNNNISSLADVHRALFDLIYNLYTVIL